MLATVLWGAQITPLRIAIAVVLEAAVVAYFVVALKLVGR